MKNESESNTLLITSLLNSMMSANEDGSNAKCFMNVVSKIYKDNIKLPEKPSSDGFYHANLKDSTRKGGRIQVKAKTIESLKEKINKKYIEISEREQYGLTPDGTLPTFKDCFDGAIERLRKEVRKGDEVSRENTINRYENSDYARFFKDTPIEHKPIAKITIEDLEDNIITNIHNYGLKKKALSNIKTILNLTFRYAVKNKYITDNIVQNIDNSSFKKLLVPDVIIAQRYHTDNEVRAMIDYLNKLHIDKPCDIRAFALHFVILTGFRRGEVPPLKWSDVKEANGITYILVDKSIIRYDGLKENQDKYPKEYLKDSTKTNKPRTFVVYPLLQDLLDSLKEVHDKYFPNSPYLFPDNMTKSGHIGYSAVQKKYETACNNLDIERDSNFKKGPHSFRRWLETQIANVSNTRIATQMLGNSESSFTEHYDLGIDIRTQKEALDKIDFSIFKTG